jgi:nucleoprotein TPR
MQQAGPARTGIPMPRGGGIPRGGGSRGGVYQATRGGNMNGRGRGVGGPGRGGGNMNPGATSFSPTAGSKRPHEDTQQGGVHQGNGQKRIRGGGS